MTWSKWAALIALAFACAVLVEAKEVKEKESGIIAKVVGNVVPAAVATIIAYALVFPADFISHSARFKARAKETGSKIKSLVDNFPFLVNEMVGFNGLDYFVQKALMLTPKVIIKLTAYGLCRGSGKAGLVTILIGGAVSGVATTLYTFPLRKVEVQQALNTKRYSDLIFALKNKATKEGILSLFTGIISTIPFAVMHNVVLFLILEIASGVLKEKVPLSQFISAVVAVFGAAILSAPLDHVRRTALAFPFDFEWFLYGRDENGQLNKSPNPDFGILWEYLLFLSDKLLSMRASRVFQHVHFRLSTAVLCIALTIHHMIIAH